MFWFVLIIISSAVVNNQAYRDYYWRDYNGTIADDAFISKMGDSKRYIGRVASNTGYYIGIVEPGDKTIYSYNQGKFSADKNLQILCVGSSNELEWVKFEKDVKSRAVYGGYQITPEYTTVYIGRDSENCIGKILLSNEHFYCYMKDRKTEKELHDGFEVLVYKNRN